MPISIVIPGLSSTTRRPGFFGETKYAAGAISAASIPLVLLLVGNKTSLGSMTPNGSPQLVTSADDVDALAGPGSELGLLAYGVDGKGGALATPGVAIWLGCVAEAAGVAATCTITITGTATSAGTLVYRLSGVRISVGVATGDVLATVAQSIVDAINSNPRLPFTAARSTGVVTVTCKNLGLRGNWHSIFQDVTGGPGGTGSALAGGSAMTGGGFHFTGGTVADTPATLLGVIASTEYDRIAIACGDATSDAVNVALWKTQLNSQASPGVGILGHAVIASNDTLTNAASITVTTLNDARWELLHILNEETHPSALAGSLASLRCATEQNDPNAAYDDATIPGAAPQMQAADKPSPAIIETALAEGVTEGYTALDGTVKVTRAIVTRCRNGASPDYRVLDTGDAIVPDFVRQALALLFTTDIKPNNPRVAPDPPPELKAALSGILTPSSWTASAMKLLKEFERGVGIPSSLPILIGVDDHPVISTYEPFGKRILSIAPVVPCPNLHSIGVSVRQLSTI